ncbi:MAG TPA: ABC transporter ATP-binding protein [Pseudobdellovibrionaceae bacterium]|nr:ABC transporter ATP-binding protein [Pseudobdellovibrionaceae bacterium]
MNVLEVKDLKKTYKGSQIEKEKLILDNVSFSLPESSTVGFVGGNGSGKTTSIKCLLDFIKPDQGTIHFWGSPLDNSTKARLGYLPERPYFYEFLTGMEFLKFHWDLCNSSRNGFQEKALQAIKKVGLEEAKDRKLRSYSKGMLQRIGIAQSTLNDPELLILDEPMSGLDPDGRMMVKEILREEQKKKITLFFTTHLLHDVEELCSHLVVIDKGKIIYVGELLPFISKYKNLDEAFHEWRGSR